MPEVAIHVEMSPAKNVSIRKETSSVLKREKKLSCLDDGRRGFQDNPDEN